MIPIVAHRRRQRRGQGDEGEFPRGVFIAIGLAVTLALLGVTIYRQEAVRQAGRSGEAALDSLRAAARVAETVLAPNARIAILSSTPSGPPDGRGRAYYDPSTGAVVVVLDRLRIEPRTTPVLWALSDAEPRFLSELQVDETGRAVLRLDDAGSTESLDALAVSLEPDTVAIPGEAPAGPVLLLGILER